MAKRTKLTAPSAEDLAKLDADFRSENRVRPNPATAPIASVAADAAITGDAEPAQQKLNRLDAAVGGSFEVVTLATGRNARPAVDKFFAEKKLTNLPKLFDPKMAVARRRRSFMTVQLRIQNARLLTRNCRPVWRHLQVPCAPKVSKRVIASSSICR